MFRLPMSSEKSRCATTILAKTTLGALPWFHQTQTYTKLSNLRKVLAMICLLPQTIHWSHGSTQKQSKKDLIEHNTAEISY